MVLISDFLNELSDSSSTWRQRWDADKSVQARTKVMKDFGLKGQKLQIMVTALQTGDVGPVRQECKNEQHDPTNVYLWVK